VVPPFVPYNCLDELDENSLLEAELEENVLRADLSVAETAAAYGRLHAYRLLQASESGIPHTVKDTASEIIGREALGSARQRVDDLLIISRHLENPDVAKAKSVSEAIKVIEKDLRAEHYSRLANSSPGGVSTDYSLCRGDVREFLPRLPDGLFTCIVTDPPYGIDAGGFGDQAAHRHTYDDRPEESRELYNLLASEGIRITRPQAHLYAFCDVRQFAELDLVFTLAGWKVWPFPLIWSKNGGMLPDPKKGPRRSYETILFAIKGDKEVQLVANDVLSIPMVSDPKRAAEKPADLYYDLLRRSVLPGDSVLDPFCGSGPIFPAAKRLRLKAVGIEKDPVAQGMAMEQINAPAPVRALLDFS
jgi:site-specific DNA-methyltransferase (adenine-specific)